MSHSTNLSHPDFLVANEAELIQALEAYLRPGCAKVHQTPVFMESQWQDMQQFGMFHITVSEHELRQGKHYRSAGNPLGFRRNDNGTFEVCMDETSFPQEAMDAVTQEYTLRTLEKTCRSNGMYMERTNLDDGRVRIRAYPSEGGESRY